MTSVEDSKVRSNKCTKERSKTYKNCTRTQRTKKRCRSAGEILLLSQASTFKPSMRSTTLAREMSSLSKTIRMVKAQLVTLKRLMRMRMNRLCRGRNRPGSRK